MELLELPEGVGHPYLERRLPKDRGRCKDLTGNSYGQWEVLQFAGFIGQFSAWVVRCKCSKLKVMRQNQLDKLGCCHHVEVPSYYCRVFNNKETVGWSSARDLFECVGERPNNKYLAAKDISKPIGPSNYIWSPFWGERIYEFEGVRGNLRTWGERCGVTREGMRQRFNNYEEGKITLAEAVKPRVSIQEARDKALLAVRLKKETKREMFRLIFEQAFSVCVDNIIAGEVYIGKTNDRVELTKAITSVALSMKLKASNRSLGEVCLVRFDSKE